MKMKDCSKCRFRYCCTLACDYARCTVMITRRNDRMQILINVLDKIKKEISPTSSLYDR